MSDSQIQLTDKQVTIGCIEDLIWCAETDVPLTDQRLHDEPTSTETYARGLLAEACTYLREYAEILKRREAA